MPSPQQATRPSPKDDFAAIAEPPQQQDDFSAISESQPVSTAPAPKKSLQQRADDAIANFTRRRTPEEIHRGDDSDSIISRLPAPIRNVNDQMESTIGNVARRGLGGVASMVVHPIDTAKGVYQTGKEVLRYDYDRLSGMPKAEADARDTGPLAQQIRSFQETYARNPREAIENLSGDLLTMYLSGKLLDAAGRPIKPLMKRAGEAMTGTGPRILRDVVDKTREANATAAEKASQQTAKDRAIVDKANAKLEADRAAEVRSHFDKTQAAKKAAEQRSGVATRKAGLESGVRTLSDKFQTDLKAVREKAAAEADAKYQALNAALGEVPADGEFLPNALVEAAQKIQGSETEPTIFRDIEKKVQRGDGFSYSDLQGYYSELGRELKRGTLAGDVYTAFSSLQDAIGGEMQRIADSKGLGPQLTDARTSWRSLKQTFYDPKSPLRKALDAKEPGGSVRALAGKDRTGIEALARYSPELAQRANIIRGYDEEARGTRVPQTSTKPSPQLAPRKPPEPYPEPHVAETKKIGEAEVRDAKGEALQKRADWIRHRGIWAATWPLFYSLRDILHGSVGQVPGALGEGAATLTAVHSIASLLERPAVAEFLTKATERDVAAIPEDIRGDFPRIIQAAKAKNMSISPSLIQAFGNAGALAPRKPEQHPTDEWQGIQQ